MKSLPYSKHNPKTGVYRSSLLDCLEIAVIKKGGSCTLYFIYLN